MRNTLILSLIFVLATGCKDDLVDTNLNKITDITSLEHLNTEIAEGVSLVFFHASWCSICAEQRPHVESASENEAVSFANFFEVEHDDHQAIFDDKGVSGFPHVLIYKDGSEVAKFKGAGHDENKLVNALKDHE